MITGEGYEIHTGDAVDALATLPDRSIHTVVTSPPYFNLRSYLPADHPDKAKEIGSEKTVHAYVEHLVAVFQAVRRVLRDDGTFWINIGDSYNAYNGNRGASSSLSARTETALPDLPSGVGLTVQGLRAKNLLGVPWRLAFALQDDGWILRQDIIWAKTAGLPESVTDRCTRSHEYLFMFAKQERYFYDAQAIAEQSVVGSNGSSFTTGKTALNGLRPGVGQLPREDGPTRNKRSVWALGPSPFSAESVGMGESDHFAVMPIALVEPCVLAGTSPLSCEHCGSPWDRVTERSQVTPVDWGGKWGNADKQSASRRMNANNHARRMGGEPHDNPFPPPTTTGWEPTCTCAGNQGTGKCVVLDPFAGSGTVGMVAIRHGRRFVGIDLYEVFARMAARRIDGERNAGNVIKGSSVKVTDGQMALFEDTRP